MHAVCYPFYHYDFKVIREEQAPPLRGYIKFWKVGERLGAPVLSQINFLSARGLGGAYELAVAKASVTLAPTAC